MKVSWPYDPPGANSASAEEQVHRASEGIWESGFSYSIRDSRTGTGLHHSPSAGQFSIFLTKLSAGIAGSLGIGWHKSRRACELLYCTKGGGRRSTCSEGRHTAVWPSFSARTKAQTTVPWGGILWVGSGSWAFLNKTFKQDGVESHALPGLKVATEEIESIYYHVTGNPRVIVQ